MRAADLLIQALISSGTDTVFSLSGNQIMSIYDAAIDQPLKLVHTRHEAGAVYMADGYARASGKTGIALVTAAPGFTNAISALYAVSATETPLVLLSGDSPVSKDKLMPFQKMDQQDVARPLVKETWRLSHPDRIGHDLASAIALAKSGRPGPVHLSLPEDILTATIEESQDLTPEQFTLENVSLGNADLPSVLSIIDRAEYPVIITGPSLHPSRAPGVADRLMKALNIPVICMQSPRGLNDPASGKIRDVIAEADSLILIDKDVDFTLASGDLEHVPANNIVLIASNAESIAHASTMLAGRLKWGCIADPLVAAQILTDVTTIKGKSPWLRQVMKKIAVRPKPPQSTDSMIAHQVMTTINTVMADANPIYVIDGGEVGQWAQSVLPLDQALINGTSGAIGGSLPQAIGAALAQPKRPIIAIMGDGTAGFYLSELDTARRLGLKLIVVIVNDLRWGAEVVIQERVYGKDRVQGCLLDDKTRYDQIAQGFGANGLYAETPEALQKALIAAGKNRKPTVINAMIKGMPAPSF